MVIIFPFDFRLLFFGSIVVYFVYTFPQIGSVESISIVLMREPHEVAYRVVENRISKQVNVGKYTHVDSCTEETSSHMRVYAY